MRAPPSPGGRGRLAEGERARGYGLAAGGAFVRARCPARASPHPRGLAVSRSPFGRGGRAGRWRGECARRPLPEGEADSPKASGRGGTASPQEAPLSVRAARRAHPLTRAAWPSRVLPSGEVVELGGGAVNARAALSRRERPTRRRRAGEGVRPRRRRRLCPCALPGARIPSPARLGRLAFSLRERWSSWEVAR